MVSDEPRAVQLPGTRVHTIRSEIAEAEYQVWVAEPSSNPRVSRPERIPVLYVVDADLWFGTATEMTRIMHGLFGELPPVLVVGLAYGTPELAVQGEIRNRDLTPTADPGFEAMARQMSPEWQPLLPEERRMGRAREFLGFIEQEVKPMVRRLHPAADPRAEVVFGASLGGLFVAWTLVTEPGSFDHYIAASPALWWDGEMLFALEEERAAGRADVAASVFLGVGSLEEGVGLPWLDRFRTVTNVRRLRERLESRGSPSLRVDARVFEGETHTSVVPVVLTRGLRWALGRRPAG
jgi:hypothetical protein